MPTPCIVSAFFSMGFLHRDLATHLTNISVKNSIKKRSFLTRDKLQTVFLDHFCLSPTSKMFKNAKDWKRNIGKKSLLFD